MPCTDGGPSYSQQQHLDDPARELNEVKREYSALKVRADEATRLLCAFGPLVPRGQRSPELEKWLAKHAEADRVRDIDDKIAALEKLKASIIKRRRK
jgi:hypothetical protein